MYNYSFSQSWTRLLCKAITVPQTFMPIWQHFMASSSSDLFFLFPYHESWGNNIIVRFHLKLYIQQLFILNTLTSHEYSNLLLLKGHIVDQRKLWMCPTSNFWYNVCKQTGRNLSMEIHASFYWILKMRFVRSSVIVSYHPILVGMQGPWPYLV